MSSRCCKKTTCYYCDKSIPINMIAQHCLRLHHGQRGYKENGSGRRLWNRQPIKSSSPYQRDSAVYKAKGSGRRIWDHQPIKSSRVSGTGSQGRRRSSPNSSSGRTSSHGNERDASVSESSDDEPEVRKPTSTLVNRETPPFTPNHAQLPTPTLIQTGTQTSAMTHAAYAILDQHHCFTEPELIQYLADNYPEVQAAERRPLVIGAVAGAKRAARLQVVANKCAQSADPSTKQAAANADSALAFWQLGFRYRSRRDAINPGNHGSNACSSDDVTASVATVVKQSISSLTMPPQQSNKDADPVAFAGPPSDAALCSMFIASADNQEIILNADNSQLAELLSGFNRDDEARSSTSVETRVDPVDTVDPVDHSSTSSVVQIRPAIAAESPLPPPQTPQTPHPQTTLSVRMFASSAKELDDFSTYEEYKEVQSKRRKLEREKRHREAAEERYQQAVWRSKQKNYQRTEELQRLEKTLREEHQKLGLEIRRREKKVFQTQDNRKEPNPPEESRSSSPEEGSLVIDWRPTSEESGTIDDVEDDVTLTVRPFDGSTLTQHRPCPTTQHLVQESTDTSSPSSLRLGAPSSSNRVDHAYHRLKLSKAVLAAYWKDREAKRATPDQLSGLY